MARNLLFINKYPEIIEEFQKEIAGREDIETDIVDNGIDAAILLRKKEYQVVVTGLVLDGFNGEQIVTYINKVYPDTVCIVYTTTISAAQLHFFINKRNVFRVFLRPVNFRLEFFQALEEAFEDSDLRKKIRLEEEERRYLLTGNKDAIKEFAATIERQKNGWGILKPFAEQMLVYSLQNPYKNGQANEEDEKRIKIEEMEKQTVFEACKNNGVGNIPQLEANVRAQLREINM